VRDAAKAGVHDLWSLQSSLGVGSNCGAAKRRHPKSFARIANLTRWNTRSRRFTPPPSP